MKYLVLLLMFFMVSNVKAETYWSLSNIEKNKILNICRLENFPDNTSYEEKGDFCVMAGLSLDELLQKEYNETKKARLLLEVTQMWVKAGNFYYLGNINNEVTNEISGYIYYVYNTICLNNSKKEAYEVSVCENLLMYKGFDETKVPTNNEEPLDFSLSDLPLRENREDVSDAIPYDKYRTTAQKVGDFAQDLGAATLGGMAQIVPTAMQVGTFVPRQINSLVGKTADALGLDSLELATKEFENKTASLIDDTYSGIRQGVEELTSDYGRYAKQKGFQWSDPFSDESLYVLSMNVAEFIGMAIPWVILFFVLRKYIFYKPKRAEKKNTDNTVSDAKVEQTSDKQQDI